MSAVYPIPAPEHPGHLSARLWRRVAYLVLASRAIDELEESRLIPDKQMYYQFSSRGHDMAQVLLGTLLDRPHDAVDGYYRSRPLMLTLGLSFEQALSASLMRRGGHSDGRDIGVVFNLPNRGQACALPMCGGVGAQYTPIAGWAQAIQYRRDVLGDSSYADSIGVALGGDASVASNGFWSALTMATTLNLPMLFYIEDNGYGISVSGDKQTPGGNIADNLTAFNNLCVLDGDGTEPREALSLLQAGVNHVRAGHSPALVRLSVPRLAGHSAQDTQAYKSQQRIAQEWARDPLPRLQSLLVPGLLSTDDWHELQARAQADVEAALEAALTHSQPDPAGVGRYAFSETHSDGRLDVQSQGGVAAEGHRFPPGVTVARPEATRLNMLTAIRRTLDHELTSNPKVVLLGEDIGIKGGVHGATLGLQQKHGERRVFDTSLSEEGIIGRSVGMALAGLMPVAEIQFRKYADPAEEQLNDCGTMRWRTANRFAAPMVVRMPGGFSKCGDPWHSQCHEVKWTHAVGWRVAMPSNAEDAVGLLRSALRGNDPVIFFEHRAMLDDAWARRQYPGDQFVIPFGRANTVQHGADLTIVTWGAMVPRCEAAAAQSDVSIEILDLRTLSPWDRAAVLQSVAKTHRCLIVHEDNLTSGFGAEVAATIADEAFFDLDAPVRRLAMPDIPSPHHPGLLDAAVPNIGDIGDAITELVKV